MARVPSAHCQTAGCNAEADLAIRTTCKSGASPVHTIWNDPGEAPGTATRYCVLHGVEIAAGLAQISAIGETHAVVTLTPEGKVARAEQGL